MQARELTLKISQSSMEKSEIGPIVFHFTIIKYNYVYTYFPLFLIDVKKMEITRLTASQIQVIYLD